METWFLNHVLGLSLSVLLLGLPGPLGAGTPSNNSTDSVTAGFYSSTATDELGHMENNATSSSSSSESLSTSQRNILLTRAAETRTAAAGNVDTEQTQTLTETSSRPLEAISLSTEPLSSTLVAATTEASSSIGSSSSSGSIGSSSSSSSIGSSSSSSSIGSSSSSSIGGIGSSSSSSIGSSSGSSSGGIGSSSSSSIGSSSGGIGSSSSSSIGSSSSSSSSSIGSSSSSSLGSSSSSSISGSSSSSSSSISSSSRSSISSSSRGWKDFLITDQVPGASPAVSWEPSSWTSTERARLPQDSPDTTLGLGDTSALVSHTAVHTDSTYTSTTNGRAGERTLLSVTSSSSSNTSSVFTEDSNSHQSPSTWGVSAGAPETEDYTRSAPPTRTDSRDTTDQHVTHSFKGMSSETGSPGGPRGTQSLDEQTNATQSQRTSASEETSDSTPTLRATEPNTDQSEVSLSSTPTVTTPAEGPTNVSGTDQGSGSSVVTSTESSTGAHSSSTQNQEGTDGVSSQTREHSVDLGLTTGPPSISSSTTELTDTPVLVTEVVFTTTPVPVTERSQTIEEDTFKATASTTAATTLTITTTTTTPPLPATSSSRFSSTAASSTHESSTEATIPYTTPSTTASTLAPRTSTAHPTHHVTPSPTQGSSTGVSNPTNVPTLQIETSTGTVGTTTAHSQHITTTYAHSTPTKSTEALQTTVTTQLVLTTSPADFTPSGTPPAPRNPCVSNPCMNGGTCGSYEGNQFTCHCRQAWTGPTCTQDMDECESDPCPAGSRCVNTRGSFSCECPLGFDLENGRTCTRAKTFLGTFSVDRLPHDPVVFKSATVHEIQRELLHLLNASLSVLRGYRRSSLSKKGEDGARISAVNTFSISADVTGAEVYNSIQMSLSNCSASLAHCRMLLHHQIKYQVESLCVAQKTRCDSERSTCSDSGGTAYCQCLQGYYKHNPDDLSCLECGDGYKLENNTCVPCMFGFGGFNCGNFYKLIAVVVSPAGGALLLILIIALIVTCCKRDKNDINKIIFKSGDLQMSPYADFPKNNRISMEWGRETIEMQENGSTKNLLQMTDIYYSPALRNSDLERNGLYPFTGLPGSRHSCIYPAQWNPSFISDDSRRRDYF